MKKQEQGYKNKQIQRKELADLKEAFNEYQNLRKVRGYRETKSREPKDKEKGERNAVQLKSQG